MNFSPLSSTFYSGNFTAMIQLVAFVIGQPDLDAKSENNESQNN